MLSCNNRDIILCSRQDTVTLAATDIDPEDPRCDRNARYVAASRAKHRLFVFEKGDWLG